MHTRIICLKGKKAVAHTFCDRVLFCCTNTFAAVTVYFYGSIVRIKRLGQRENKANQSSLAICCPEILQMFVFLFYFPFSSYIVD